MPFSSDIACLIVHFSSPADCSGPIYRSRGLTRRPADIPPIDPAVLVDLQRHTQEVAHSVEMMMRSLNGTIQNVSKKNKQKNGHTGTLGVSRRYSLTSVSVAPDDGSECRIHPDLQGLGGQPGGVGGHEYKGVFVCFYLRFGCVAYFHILTQSLPW